MELGRALGHPNQNSIRPPGDDATERSLHRKTVRLASDRVLYNQLRNPIWTGYRVYSHKRGEKRPSRNGRQADRKKIRRAEPLRVKLNIEPLVSEEQFAQAQAI